MYGMTSNPLKARHARELASEAEESGIRVVKSGRIPLHGKFLPWDEGDLVITSVNWASASSDPDFPEGEVGVSKQPTSPYRSWQDYRPSIPICSTSERPARRRDPVADGHSGYLKSLVFTRMLSMCRSGM